MKDLLYVRGLAALLIVLYLMTTAATVHAKNWQVIPEESHIEFSGIYAGLEFKGEFKDWTATITFDPSNLETAKAQVDIELSSATTGNTTYDKTLPTADWFNVKKEPKAQFSTSEFHKEEKTYLAKGTLNLRGKTLPVDLKFTFSETGNTAKLDGKTTLNRLEFDIGKSSDPTGDWVKPNIEVHITVSLKQEQN